MGTISNVVGEVFKRKEGIMKEETFEKGIKGLRKKVKSFAVTICPLYRDLGTEWGEERRVPQVEDIEETLNYLLNLLSAGVPEISLWRSKNVHEVGSCGLVVGCKATGSAMDGTKMVSFYIGFRYSEDFYEYDE